MVVIKGLQKTSLIDFSPYTSCVVFLAGCPFRCGFCHNPELVKNTESLKTIKEKEFFDFLNSRKGWLDGVCITGGEPTIHNDLVEFISKIKEKGYKVKLDTNGSNPDVLKKIIDEKLADYIAMDVKSSMKNYKKTINRNFELSRIKKSMKMIMNSKVDYEFRTTVVPGWVTKEDVKEIGKVLNGAKKYYIQNFRATKHLLDENFEKIKPYSKEDLEEMKKESEKHFEVVGVRN